MGWLTVEADGAKWSETVDDLIARYAQHEEAHDGFDPAPIRALRVGESYTFGAVKFTATAEQENALCPECNDTGGYDGESFCHFCPAGAAAQESA